MRSESRSLYGIALTFKIKRELQFWKAHQHHRRTFSARAENLWHALHCSHSIQVWRDMKFQRPTWKRQDMFCMKTLDSKTCRDSQIIDRRMFSRAPPIIDIIGRETRIGNSCRCISSRDSTNIIEHVTASTERSVYLYTDTTRNKNFLRLDRSTQNDKDVRNTGCAHCSPFYIGLFELVKPIQQIRSRWSV